MGDWNTLQGYIGLRAAEEARTAECWHGEYERHDHGTTWEPVSFRCESKASWTDIEDVDDGLDWRSLFDSFSRKDMEKHKAEQERAGFRNGFFARRKEQVREGKAALRILYSEVHDREDLYILLSLIAKWDETSDKLEYTDVGVCAKYGLRPLVPLCDFLENAILRAEQMVKERELRAARRKWLKLPKAVRCEAAEIQDYIAANQDEKVRLGSAKGYLFAFSVPEQIQIAKREVLQ